MAAVGGFNRVVFNVDGSIEIKPVIISSERKNELNDHLLMFFSGISRNSQTITEQKINDIKNKPSDVSVLGEMVHEALSILISPERDIMDFGRLMDEAWKIKRGISSNISNETIDTIYNTAMRNGAIGGKLMGAGGGGFMTFFAPPDKHPDILNALADFVHVPFRFEHEGCTICVYEPNGF